MKPQFSIVIPAYNEARFIEACLQSLKAQDFFGSYEIIVVDNNSSDNTGAIASGFGAKIIFEPTRGVCAARQAGTLAATGEVVISTDADTVFPRNWLSRIYTEFMRHPDAVAVAGTCEFVNAPWWARLYANALFGTNSALYERTGRVGYISACNTAFKKTAWTGYNIRLTQGEDEFGLLSQLKRKGRMVYLRDNLVFTSSRRFYHGLWYHTFVNLMLYCGADYLIGKIIGKSLLGSYAPIREEHPTMSRRRAWIQGISTLMIVLVALSLVTHRVSAARVLQVTKTGLVSLQHKIHLRHR